MDDIMKNPQFSAADFNEVIEENLSKVGIDWTEATAEHIYKATVTALRDMYAARRKQFKNKARKNGEKEVYYFCIEFLLGRALKNAIYCGKLESNFRQALSKYRLTPEDLYECEPDPGLGNGGLGRLAACFMASLASQNYLATGFSICYEYGMFKQKLVDGWQMELPDVWLPNGECWLVPRLDEAVDVKFGGRIEEIWENGILKLNHIGETVVHAIPYDMMIPGYDTQGVSKLRLWRAKSSLNIDMHLFSQGDYVQASEEATRAEMISKILYPPDEHIEGKSLRLKQQYFLVSASLNSVIKRHMKRYGTLDSLPQKAVFHINDTHPSLVIPELMRILIDDFGYSWDKAWNITTNIVAYTNHTVMSEALETWDEQIFATILPRLHSILKEINKRFCKEVFDKTNGNWNKVSRIAVLSYDTVKMANLSVIASKKVNGVSKLHSEILKNTVFKDYYDLMPEKFENVTNGIDFRRWLCQANPGLTNLLKECIGDRFIKQSAELVEFLKFQDDPSVLNSLSAIKLENKKRFIKRIDIPTIDPLSVFDVHAKRLHEYKRQLLNALHILYLYVQLKSDPQFEIPKTTFIFAAKAASSYYMAKRIILLINSISEMIKKDKRVSEFINVVFLENYSVTWAEYLMPASEISEQISQAGTEASGTGNMKMMINGALTLGTLDGANIEILEEVGNENIYIFGMKTEEVSELYKKGYYPASYILKDPVLAEIISMLNNNINGINFSDIANYLTMDMGFADPYMVVADFDSYKKIHRKIYNDYANAYAWNKKSLVNIAKAGKFSSDRSIVDYAEKIWKVTPVDYD
jgi:starch phosphorylase